MHFRLILTALLVLLVGALDSPVGSEPDILPTDAVTRGMKGVGRTVFHGTKIDSFDVEILGVVKNVFGARSDVILARLSGETIDRTQGILGISGSPVFVDGKLIGAVALGWAFSKEAVMGITPIEEMLEILDRPDTVPATRMGATSSLSRKHDPLNSMDLASLRPVTTPVFASGFASSVVDDLRDRLAPYGLLPVQGTGGADASLPDGPLEPGAAIGVQFVRGDLDMTSIGTLTWIEGDRTIAWGHPMMFSGTTSLPMTTAFIHDVIPSQFISFKIGSAVRQIGAVTQDRAPGIGGVLGQTVDMMPVSIVVRSPSREETYEIEVLRDRRFGPLYTQASIVSALITSQQAAGEVTVSTRSTIELDGYDPLELENVYAGPLGLGESIGGVTRPFDMLVQNPYETVRVVRASFDLDVVETVHAAKIVGVRLDRSRFEAGDAVDLRVIVRPYLGEPHEIATSVVLPSFVKDQQLTLRVSSAKDHNTADAKRVPAEYRPQDISHLLRKLGELPRNDEMVIELSAQRRGATIEGREMAVLPPSVLAALAMGRESGSIAAVSSSVLSHERVSTDYVLSGSQTVFLYVGDQQPGLRFGGTHRRTSPSSTEKEGR